MERQRPKDPKQILAAMKALDTLFTDPETDEVNIGRRLTALRIFRSLTINAAAQEGLAPDKKFLFVRDGLMADAIIDPNNPELATNQLRIMQEGYEAAPELWDKWIGRQRRYLLDVADDFHIRDADNDF